jgi:hypothetical protein
MVRSPYILAMTSAVLLGGCSDPNEGRMEVSGTVQLKGSPLKDGIVLFEALDGQDTGGSAQISGGKFELPAESGLKPGKYLVRVTAGDGVTAVDPINPDAPPGPSGGTNIVSKDLVPKEWTVNSKQQVTVTKEGPNTFDLDIK